MKKLTKTLLAVLSVATMAASMFSLAACNEGKTVDCSEGHHYENGVCTECQGKEPEAVKPWVDAGTCVHADTNADGKCDTCGTVMAIYSQGTCATHTDEDGNGKCDSCGAGMDSSGTAWRSGVTAVELSKDSYTAKGQGAAKMMGAIDCDAYVNFIVTKTSDSYTADLQVCWNAYGGAVVWASLYTNESTILDGYSKTGLAGDGLQLTSASVTKGEDNVYTAKLTGVLVIKADPNAADTDFSAYAAVNVSTYVNFVVDESGNMTAQYSGELVYEATISTGNIATTGTHDYAVDVPVKVVLGNYLNAPVTLATPAATTPAE